MTANNDAQHNVIKTMMCQRSCKLFFPKLMDRNLWNRYFYYQAIIPGRSVQVFQYFFTGMSHVPVHQTLAAMQMKFRETKLLRIARPDADRPIRGRLQHSVRCGSTFILHSACAGLRCWNYPRCAEFARCFLRKNIFLRLSIIHEGKNFSLTCIICACGQEIIRTSHEKVGITVRFSVNVWAGIIDN